MENLSDLGCFLNYTLLLTLALYYQLRNYELRALLNQGMILVGWATRAP
ncbi:hypothetical protein [Nostoc sp.]